MCRNIRTLHNFEPRADGAEIEAAALQYVRKIAGTTKPSKGDIRARLTRTRREADRVV